MTFNTHPEGVLVMRFLPHPTDPEKCFYHVWIISRHLKDGTRPPAYMGVENDVDISGKTRPARRYNDKSKPELGEVLEQDIANVEGVQRGLRNEPASTVKPSKPDHWSGPTAIVKNGFATLQVPTAYTAGASFTVTAPWEGQTDGVTNVVLGGKTPPSTIISVARAMHRSKGTACWAGTQDGQAIIRVTVIKAKLRGLDNKPTHFPIAWASPTVATVGPLTKTLGKGLLGNQDMFFC